LRTLFADAGYHGRQFQQALADVLPSIEAQIIKRPRQAKGFVHLPKRWIVERTICMAQPLSKARQGLGEPQSQRPRLLASRLNSPHAAKALQSNLMFPDRRLYIPFQSPLIGLDAAARWRQFLV